jgi:hypothetical protein
VLLWLYASGAGSPLTKMQEATNLVAEFSQGLVFLKRNVIIHASIISYYDTNFNACATSLATQGRRGQHPSATKVTAISQGCTLQFFLIDIHDEPNCLIICLYRSV